MDFNLQTATADELRAFIARMQSQPRVTLKVTEKGGVSLYGLGQFPVTLYASQWERVIAAAPEIAEFLKINRAKLAVKPPKVNAKA